MVNGIELVSMGFYMVLWVFGEVSLHMAGPCVGVLFKCYAYTSQMHPVILCVSSDGCLFSCVLYICFEQRSHVQTVHVCVGPGFHSS